MAWTNPPRTWTDGELVTAAIMNTHVRDQLSLVPHIIAKSADESVTSSTVLQDDDHLTFAIGVSESWWFQFALCRTGPGGLKIALNAPTGATGFWSYNSWASAINAQRITTAAATFVDGETASESDGTADVHTVDGYVLNSSTGGTFKLRWAQTNSNGTATVIKKGSHLLIGRLT
jgi:hypothetical protein